MEAKDRTVKDAFAYMLGPKGENMEVFRRLITEALDDHVYWRRNFHPEDEPAISTVDQDEPGFKFFVDRLRDHLSLFLRKAKDGVPFFSPRYIGHMNTDLLIPAMAGYFAAMLYNSNIVVGESSPVTVRLEREVAELLLRMVGMDPKRGWGDLGPRGTEAPGLDESLGTGERTSRGPMGTPC